MPLVDSSSARSFEQVAKNAETVAYRISMMSMSGREEELLVANDSHDSYLAPLDFL